MSEPPDPGTRSERVVILLESAPRELDPRLVSDSSSTKVARLISCGLTTVETDDLRPVPEAAASVVPSCASSCSRWVVTLRDDVFWHDGEKVTAADVVYTYRSIMESDLPSPFRGALRRKIRSVTAVDAVGTGGAQQVVFDLHRPVAAFPVDLSLGLVPAHVLEPRGGLSGRFGDRIVGCGPYRFLYQYRDQKVVLERNDRYFKPVGPRYVVVRSLPDEATRLLAVTAGSGDVAVNLLSPPLVRHLQGQDDVTVASRPAAGVTYLAFNLLDERLADVRVRKAIAMGIDRASIVERQFGGMAKVASSVLPPMHWAFAKSASPVPFDPDTARALLEEAGYGPGLRPLSFTIKCTTDRFRRNVAEIMAHQLEASGMHVDVLPLEISTFLDDVRKGSFEMYTLQAPEILDPDILRWFFHSQAAPVLRVQAGRSRFGEVDRTLYPPHFEDVGGPFREQCVKRWFPMVQSQAEENRVELAAGRPVGIGNGNRSSFYDPTLDCLLDLAYTTMDRDEGIKMYEEAQRMIAEALPILPLWHEDNVAVLSRGISGYRLLPINRFTGVAEVHLER